MTFIETQQAMFWPPQSLALYANVKDSGAMGDNIHDDTAAFQSALAALPTTTIYANPNNNTGASATYHYGTLFIPPGTYKLGSSQDIGNIGPLVNILGSGPNATVLNYYGSGDCIRMYNTVSPASVTFDDLAAFHGIIDMLTIDGTNSMAGAVGIHYGDTEGGTLGPALFIRNFSGTISAPVIALGTTGSGGSFTPQTYYWRVTAVCGTTRCQETATSNEVNHSLGATDTQQITWSVVTNATGYHVMRATAGGDYELIALITSGSTTSYVDAGTNIGAIYGWPVASSGGSVGLLLDNQYSWTENIFGRVNIYNCTTCVLVSGGISPSWTSFMYNDLTLKCYCLAGQNAVFLQNGANYSNGSMKIRANMANAGSTQANALLTLQGASGGNTTQMNNNRLDLQAETDLGGGHGPMTLRLWVTNHQLMSQNMGTMVFGGGTWQQSNWSPVLGEALNFTYFGTVSGDSNLGNGFSVTGPFVYGTGVMYSDGGSIFGAGDIFTPLVLSQNITISIQFNQAGPQRKTIFIQQAASGGPYTVAWPKPGSPTLNSSAVYWAGGSAPTMSAGASAIDMYTLETYDGIHWYGRAIQNLS